MTPFVISPNKATKEEGAIREKSMQKILIRGNTKGDQIDKT